MNVRMRNNYLRGSCRAHCNARGVPKRPIVTWCPGAEKIELQILTERSGRARKICTYIGRVRPSFLLWQSAGLHLSPYSARSGPVKRVVVAYVLSWMCWAHPWAWFAWPGQRGRFRGVRCIFEFLAPVACGCVPVCLSIEPLFCVDFHIFVLLM